MKYLKSSKINRFILALVTISLVVSFSFAPRKTNAWIGISDVSIDSATNILSYAEKVWTAYLASEGWWKSWILDPLIYVVAQELLSDITESTVNWINSGFEGSPLYDVNFADSVKNGLNEASGVFIDKMGGAEICSNLKEGLGASFSYESSYEMKMKCTINDVIDNVSDFYDDFTTGGWRTWVTLTVEPQNNPYGAYITTADEYTKLRAEKAKAVQDEIESGGGFKSFKTCDEYSKDLNGNDTTNCKHWTIQTPGKTIEARMSKASGVDFGSLQMADEMSEIIGALLMQAMKAIFEEGSSSDSSGDSGGGGLTGADLSQDATPATIAEDMANLKVNLQIYYDYFTATSTKLINGLHYEMRQTILSQYIHEENYWRLAQYCKNEGQTEANGISGATYLKDIIEATQDVVKAQRAAQDVVIQENIDSANGLYIAGFTDDNGNGYKGVYDALYVNSGWSNVTSRIISAWERKLSELQTIQRGDTNKLKMSKMGKDSAKDSYDEKCCDIDLGTAVLCAINPFCQVCSIGISILGADFNIIDVCEQLCPCEKMENDCEYKTGENYRSCTEDLNGTVCSRNDICEGGTMRPTLDNAFCCINGTCTARAGAGGDIYGTVPTPTPDEPEPVVPNGCAGDMDECSADNTCCDEWTNTCGHTSSNTTNYCYPSGIVGLIEINDSTGTPGTRCITDEKACSTKGECCSETAICGNINGGRNYCYLSPKTLNSTFIPVEIKGTLRGVNTAGGPGQTSCGSIPPATWNKAANPECSVSIAGSREAMDGLCRTGQCDTCYYASSADPCAICLGRDVTLCRFADPTQ